MDYVQVINLSPGLRWVAMLKMTTIELELIPDPDKYIFFEKGPRGRISRSSNRCTKAKSKYLNFYNPKR